MTQLNFINKNWNLKEYLLSHSATINNAPIGQRKPVEKNPIGGKKPSKAQAIIDVIFSGDDLSEIKIADISDRGTKYSYESIDGGHRKRAINAFFRGNFPTHASSVIGEKYFSQLSEEEKDIFYAYRVRFVIYPKISKFDIGKQFRVTNTTTDVNFIEQMNSYGDMPFANMIRDFVMGDNAHSIFSWHLSADGNKIISDYLQFDNHRLRQMLIVARLAVSRFNETWTTTDNQIQVLYERDWTEKELSGIKNKIETVLDYMYLCTIVRKNDMKTGLTEREFVGLYRFIKYLIEEFGVFDIRGIEFWRAFKKAYDVFNPHTPKGIARKFIHDSKGERRVADAFMGYLWDHGNEKKIVRCLEWLKKAFDQEKINILDLIEIKDKKRFFPKELIETTLSRQSYTCWIDEKPLSMDDAVGAHIKAHSLGGKTIPVNLAVVRKTHNTAMGEMNASQYKELYMDD